MGMVEDLALIEMLLRVTEHWTRDARDRGAKPEDLIQSVTYLFRPMYDYLQSNNESAKAERLAEIVRHAVLDSIFEVYPEEEEQDRDKRLTLPF